MEKAAISADMQATLRFILGRQGLWPGRRWSGREDLEAALENLCRIQVDPLNAVGRNHDLALHGRIDGYRPEHLQDALYNRHTAFEWGATLFVYPVSQFRFMRARMELFGSGSDWSSISRRYSSSIDEVLRSIERNGPMGNRDFKGNRKVDSYVARKDTGIALYFLWLHGDLMISGRRRSEKLYDLTDRVIGRIPDAAPADEAEEQLIKQRFKLYGASNQTEAYSAIRTCSFGKVKKEHVVRKLRRLVRDGTVAEVSVRGWKGPGYILAETAAELSAVASCTPPVEWKNSRRDATETVFLAPLETVTARGRSRSLFGFRYRWEVYVRAPDREWGYYTLPVLHGDRLRARIDMRADHSSGTLRILGFWPESEDDIRDSDFASSLGLAIGRLAEFNGVDSLDAGGLPSTQFRSMVVSSSTLPVGRKLSAPAGSKPKK